MSGKSTDQNERLIIFLVLPLVILFLLSMLLWPPTDRFLNLSQSDVLVFVLSILFLYFGLGLLINAYRSYNLGRDSLWWPSVEGEIVESVLKPMPQLASYPEIVYQYSLDDTKFVSNRISVGHGGGMVRSYSKRASRKILAKYPKGSKVTVYYNPTKLVWKEYFSLPIWGKFEKKYIDNDAQIGYSLLETGYPFYRFPISGYLPTAIVGFFLALIGAGLLASFASYTLFIFISLLIVGFVFLPWRDP